MEERADTGKSWAALVACTLLVAYVYGRSTTGLRPDHGWTGLCGALGLYHAPLSSEFSTTNESSVHLVNAVVALPMIGISLAAPLAALLYARLGARLALVLSTLVTAFAYIASAYTVRAGYSRHAVQTSLWALVGSHLLLGSSMAAMALVATVVQTRLFVRHVRTALTVLSLGDPLGCIALPAIVGRLLADYGWRPCMQLTGVAIFFVALPAIVCLVSRSPHGALHAL